jgi:hypothetical protein
VLIKEVNLLCSTNQNLNVSSNGAKSSVTRDQIRGSASSGEVDKICWQTPYTVKNLYRRWQLIGDRRSWLNVADGLRQKIMASDGNRRWRRLAVATACKLSKRMVDVA